MTEDRFLICLPFTLTQECPFPNDWSNRKNFSNDAHDPGGETMCGIIQREYDIYRKSKGLATQDVSKISQTEGQDIYLNSYWLPKCPQLVPGLDLQYFDSCVNEGNTEATKILQSVLNIPSDGDWGSLTDTAVSIIKNPTAIIQAFTVRREVVYREMKGFQYFGKDWISRSQEIGAEALKMVAVS